MTAPWDWDDLADEGWGEPCDPDDPAVMRWADTDPDTTLWYGEPGHMFEARPWEPLGGWQVPLFEDPYPYELGRWR
jgi:hypothetical protein